MTRIVPILCILVILPAARAGELYWSAPVTIAEATGLVNGQQLGSDLAVDGEGTWFAVWADRYYVSDDAYHHIYGATSTDNGQTWSERITVASPGGGYPHVAYADNVWGITAYSTADKTLYFYRSTDLLNWSAPIALQYDPGMVSIDRHDLEVDAAGRTWMVTWREWDEENPFDKRVWCSRSGDGGLTWSSAGPLGHHFEDAAHQGIDSGVATDGQGTWV